jgi:hypothetical protein
MKKILYLLCFLCLGALLCNGCKFFRKSNMKKMDTLTKDTLENPVPLDSTISNVQPEASQPEVGVTSAAHNKYYMIVGCFTVKQNAEKYAEKIKGMGYDAQIIPGRDNFMMVTAQTYDNYRQSINDIEKFRNNVHPDAWVHRER